jgi:hypothetical protein
VNLYQGTSGLLLKNAPNDAEGVVMSAAGYFTSTALKYCSPVQVLSLNTEPEVPWSVVMVSWSSGQMAQCFTGPSQDTLQVLRLSTRFLPLSTKPEAPWSQQSLPHCSASLSQGTQVLRFGTSFHPAIGKRLVGVVLNVPSKPMDPVVASIYECWV